jgi:ABC-type uncharacterized transport system substrate-binding protein
VRRREFIVATAFSAAIGPAVAQQSPAHAKLGWLAHGDTMPRQFFDQAMARLGWIEGKNFSIERRFSGSAGEQIDEVCAKLVASRPDVIVAMGAQDAKPLLALTRTIPIVVITAADPIGAGLATSLARPGGNVTGVAAVTAELAPKVLELVREFLPAADRVSVLADPNTNKELPRSVGEALGLAILSRYASRPDELESAFAAAGSDGDQAIVVRFSAVTFENRWRIADLAAHYRLPAVYQLREYVDAGGLISYGPAIKENFERAAVLVDKILHGAKPADLPIEQPTKFELVINLKTAKALGLTVPQSLLARADEVVE